MQFTYSAEIYEQLHDETKKPIEHVSGEVSAASSTQAKQRVFVPILARMEELGAAQGRSLGVRAVEIKAILTPGEYQRCALRTLYPDLTTNERLGLCGLGLSGEIGEVTDLLKKFLYHRNGLPLAVDQIKDELGDMLWYFFILLDTLGISFEEVMMANAQKLEERHPNGFNPHYSSDSHASEVSQ